MLESDHSEAGHQALAEFWEAIDLVVYLAITVLVAPLLSDLLVRAWESGDVGRTVVGGLRELSGLSLVEFVLVWMGFYFGLVVLLLFDSIKRTQGLLLAVAAGLVVFLIRGEGFLTPLSPVENVPALGAGLLAAFVVGGGIRVLKHRPPYEFRRALRLLFATSALLVTVGFVDHHLVHGSPESLLALATDPTASLSIPSVAGGTHLLVDTASVATFLVGAYLFTSYEARNDTVFFGWPRSGKTTLGAQLNIAAEELSPSTSLNPSGPLSSLVSALRMADEGWGDEKYTGPTSKGEVHYLRFRTLAGRIFKRYVELSIPDAAGEYLDEELVDHVASLAPRRRLSLSWFVYAFESAVGRPAPPERMTGLESEEVRRVLAKQVVHSDTLVLVVDSGTLVPNLPYGADDYVVQQDLAEYVDTYVQILRHLEESALPEKDVVLVATKADYLRTEYQRTETQLRFHEWVNFHLLETDEGREKLGPLVNQAQIERIYPVHFEIDQSASTVREEPVPARPLKAHGNEALMRRIKEGS